MTKVHDPAKLTPGAYRGHSLGPSEMEGQGPAWAEAETGTEQGPIPVSSESKAFRRHLSPCRPVSGGWNCLQTSHESEAGYLELPVDPRAEGLPLQGWLVQDHLALQFSGPATVSLVPRRMQEYRGSVIQTRAGASLQPPGPGALLFLSCALHHQRFKPIEGNQWHLSSVQSLRHPCPVWVREHALLCLMRKISGSRLTSKITVRLIMQFALSLKTILWPTATSCLGCV